MDTFTMQLFNADSWSVNVVIAETCLVNYFILAWVCIFLLTHDKRFIFSVEKEQVPQIHEKPFFLLFYLLFLYLLVDVFFLDFYVHQFMEAFIMVHITLLCSAGLLAYEAVLVNWKFKSVSYE